MWVEGHRGGQNQRGGLAWVQRSGPCVCSSGVALSVAGKPIDGQEKRGGLQMWSIQKMLWVCDKGCAVGGTGDVQGASYRMKGPISSQEFPVTRLPPQGEAAGLRAKLTWLDRVGRAQRKPGGCLDF